MNYLINSKNTERVRYNMKFVTDDGKSFNSMEDALKHEEDVEKEKREREDERKRKKLAFEELKREFEKLNEKIDSYNKLYNDNLDKAQMTGILKIDNPFKNVDIGLDGETLASLIRDMLL